MEEVAPLELSTCYLKNNTDTSLLMDDYNLILLPKNLTQKHTTSFAPLLLLRIIGFFHIAAIVHPRHRSLGPRRL